MANCIVEIGDESGNSFKVSVLTGFDASAPGSWRAIDKGFICVNSGQTVFDHSNGTLTTKHIQFLGGDNCWGLRLNDFEDIFSVNKQGTGVVLQPWVLKLKSGRISWTVVG